ncbi:MAG TPA: EAL domain-containing protein [Gammaproteobacteria bacterium]|nr:EAL domain-containing protein [Gammaproteobacteria bacterium]
MPAINPSADQPYRELFEQSITGMYRTTPAGDMLAANTALADLLGYDSAQQLIAELNSVNQLYVEPGARDSFIAELEDKGRISGQEFALKRRDGAIVWVTQHARTVREPINNELLYFEGAVQDITARKQAEKALQKSEQRYRILVDNSQVGVFIRKDSHYIYVNPALAAMLGYTEAELIGRHYHDLYAPEDLSAADNRHRTHMQGEQTKGEYEARLLHKDGQTRVIVSCTTSHFVQDGVTLMTGTVRDITQQKRIERQLRHNATHDPLTGLPNRTLFTERLQRVMQYERDGKQPGYAVLFLDFDAFELVNDSLGHAAGDQLLIDIAQRLQQRVRPWDTLARHGGDEFTILLEQIYTARDAFDVAEHIHTVLQQPLQLGDHEVFTNASIGIALGQPAYNTTEEILRNADTAMYQAKARGKSATALFDDSMLVAARGRLLLETQLRNALNANEFRIFYQPIFDLKNQRLTGFETLLRWQHPQRGLLGPDAFLTVAQEAGLILPIGWWVLFEACSQLTVWRKRFPVARGLSVSVNIAERQFTHADLPARVAEALQQSNLPPNALNIEITETVFMESRLAARDILQRLKQLGVSVHMDDFGTGYSSLSYLDQLPLDALKIDRSFITGLTAGRRPQAIIKTIVQLAREFKLTTVAEGIETHEQARLLRRIGCHYGQGWFFEKALPADEIETLLQKSK